MGSNPLLEGPRRFSRLLCGVLAALCAVGWASTSAACPTYPNSFPSDVFSQDAATCFTCHTSTTTGPRNQFGLDWFASCVSGCTSVCGLDCFVTAWVDCGSAQVLDSDGDLFTNGEELDPRRQLPPGVFNSIDECNAAFDFDDDCAQGASGCSDPDFLVRGDYTCSCPSGLDAPGSDGRASGNGCIDVDECDEGLDDCLENSTCSNTEGSFDCTCDPGFSGSGHAGQGCTDQDFCDPNPCDPLTTCQSTLDGAVCSACPDGYEGDGADVCSSIDFCATDNGGCSPLVDCTPLPGGSTCGPCPANYAGSGVGADGCVEDVCRVCSPFATCNAAAPQGTPVCTCNVGFTGDGTTCRDVDECVSGSASCGANAVCGNLFGTYLCACAAGFHFDGTACVANAFTRVDAPPALPLRVDEPRAAPELPRVTEGSLAPAATSGGCALSSAAPASSRSLPWAALGLVAVLVARRRRSYLVGLALGLVSLVALGGCGDDDTVTPGGVGGSAGTSSEAGAGGSSPGGSAGSGGVAGAGGSAGGGAGGSGGQAGTGGGGAGGTGPVSCTHSRDCPAGEWCNPNGDVCQRRDALGAALTFQDIFPQLQTLGCRDCHIGGLETNNGYGPLAFDEFESAYAALVTDGVSCQTEQHRLCVEDPRSSLMITKVFAGLNPPEQTQSVVFYRWDELQLQQILRWIASGAQRRGPCGNRVIDPGEACDDGLTPPTRCPYGQATCQVCTKTCQLTAGTPGPTCGDGTPDVGHEICDDGNTTVEPAGANGGAVCGAQCTYVPGN